MKTIRCILKSGKERALLGRHPWIYSGAIDQIDDAYAAGDIIRVYSHDERFLGIGYFSSGDIAVRMLTFEDVPIDGTFFEQRIQNAVALRRKFIPKDTDAYRVIHSEADFLPGLIVDRYADFLVMQIQTLGMERWREFILKSLLAEIPGLRGIYQKTDPEWQKREGLLSQTGTAAGDLPPDRLEVQENGIALLVDLKKGQKTGGFLDQRENRHLIRKVAGGRRVLNCFCYSGGFSVYAALGGALETVSIDSSKPALELARENFTKHALIPEAHRVIEADVFDYLRKLNQDFDLIILDPPAFCKSKGQIPKAARGYKDINLLALKHLRSGGLLFTASCSSYINPDLFQKIVFSAAKDAQKDARILARTGHAMDHPISIAHPEGEYLKGILVEVA